jgi:hypothetical protein
MPTSNGQFSRIWRFTDEKRAKDPIYRSDFDVAMDDLAQGINEALAPAGTYPSIPAFLNSGASAAKYVAGSFILAGAQTFKVAPNASVDFHEVTNVGPEGDGGLKVYEAGGFFSSLARATSAVADTLNLETITVAGITYVHDPNGVDLTTGDSRKWSLGSLLVRRATTEALDGVLGAFAEMQIDVITKELRVFDGQTPGGFKVGRKPSEDVAGFLASQEGSWGIGTVRQAGPHFYVETEEPDALVRNSAEVRFRVIPGPNGLDVSACGADGGGEVACDAILQAACDYAAKRGFGVYLPSGVYKLEKGIKIRGSDAISGFRKYLDISGSGENSCVFVTENAPAYAFRIDARYVRLRNIRVMGSIDGIRDSDHSAKIGIWVENMREGALENIKVENIVGPGIQIDRCIVSRFEGVIVYRCGDATRPALYQTSATQDGFQASWLQASVEDAIGPVGGVLFSSHRNSHITVKLENQPQVYVEIGSPSGQVRRGETVTFSGGAVATVALTSNNPDTSVHGNVELVLTEVSGAIAVGESFTVTAGNSFDAISGATGTVKVAPTMTTGPQFWAGGEYGTFDIYANQNRLKADPEAGDITFACSDSHILKGQVRGPHVGYGVVITGQRNAAQLLYVDQGLTDLAEEASRYDAVLFSPTAANNTVHTLRTRNAKGVDNAGSRNRIDQLDQTNLYGRSYRGQGNHSGVVYANVQQLADVEVNSPVNLQGEGTFFGTGGGVISAPAATGEVVLRSRLGPVQIPDMGAANYNVRLSGEATSADGSTLTVAADKTGIQHVAVRGEVRDCIISGGAKGIYARNAGAAVRGGQISGYTSVGVHFDPPEPTAGMRVEGVTFYSAGAGASADIQFADTVTKSHAINNSVTSELGATGTVTTGTGTGNIFDQNAA